MNGTLAIMGIGGMQILLLMGATLLLFGPKKLPELARGLGRGIREFKKASSEVTEELQRTFEEPPPAPAKSYSEYATSEHSVSRALNDSPSPVVSENGDSPSPSADSQQPK